MPTDTWKAWNRYVCRKFGGERTWVGEKGADCREEVLPFVIECKYGKQVPKKLEKYMLQVEGDSDRCKGNIPIVAMKRRGMADKDGYVMMRMSDFLDWYV